MDADSNSNPFTEVVGYWEEVIDDMEATAAEYRETGWDIVELHPGDVTVLNDEQYGFDVLVPDDEFDQLETVVANAVFEDTRVFHAEDEGIAFVLTVVLDSDREVGICCPLYYELQNVGDLRKQTDRDGRLDMYVRTLSNDRSVTISHDDPDLFFPELTDGQPDDE
jgi:hypothetical protein